MLELKKLCLTANDENGKTEILKNNTQGSPIVRNLASLQLGNIDSIDNNRAGLRNQFMSQHLHKSRLTGTAGAYHKYKLPLVDMNAHIFQGSMLSIILQ